MYVVFYALSDYGTEKLSDYFLVTWSRDQLLQKAYSLAWKSNWIILLILEKPLIGLWTTRLRSPCTSWARTVYKIFFSVELYGRFFFFFQDYFVISESGKGRDIDSQTGKEPMDPSSLTLSEVLAAEACGRC